MKSYSNVQGMGASFANKTAQLRRVQPMKVCVAHKNIGCDCPEKRKKHTSQLSPKELAAIVGKQPEVVEA